MLEVLVFADALEGAVGTPVHVTRDVGMVGDHVVGEGCGLDGSVWTMFALVYVLFGVLFLVSSQRVVVAGPVVALIASERFVAWKQENFLHVVQFCSVEIRFLCEDFL